MTTCLGIRNAMHWADARSIERISCLFYFDGEMALVACVLRATTKKVVNVFEKKCIRVTWLEHFLTSK